MINFLKNTTRFIESNPNLPEVETLIWAITSNGSDRIAKDTGVGIVIKMEQNENN